jgi:phage shock protein A
MQQKVVRAEAVSQASSELAADTVDDKFAVLEKEQEIDRLLAELKARRS